MGFVEALGITPGITAILGSGGKTSLMERLAHELALLELEGTQPSVATTIALTTTTRVLPPLELPLLANTTAEATAGCLPILGMAYVGSTSDTKGIRKLAAPTWDNDPCTAIETLARMATYTLVEADGSRRLPLKAHAAWEPVVPRQVERIILVVGASGFDKPIEHVVHRPELFCQRTQRSPQETATAELVAEEVAVEVRAGLLTFDAAFVNQADNDATLAKRATAFATALKNEGLDLPVWYGGALSGIIHPAG